jgi:hypothetical protein
MKIAKYLSLLLLIAFVACKPKPQKIPPFKKSFSTYIASFTSGMISKKATIKIGFTRAVSDSFAHVENLIVFKPNLSGEFSLLDQNTLEFIPEHDLVPGQVYTARLDMSRLMEVPDSLSEFEFGFQVMRPDFEWGSLEFLASPNTQMERYKIRGTLTAADEEEKDVLQKMITVELDGRAQKVKWMQGKLPLQYYFEVDSLYRKQQTQKVEVTVNRDVKGSRNLSNKSLTLPAKGDFKFMGYSVQRAPAQHIRLSFSDPIDESQDLSGLLSLKNAGQLRFEVENTAILVYPQNETYGTRQLLIYPGIRNIEGGRFKRTESFDVEFKNEKPQVKLIGDGNIIPVNEKLLLPFQAIGLKAVDVKVVKIPESNMLQFLQNNTYGGESELYRVGEVVSNQKMDLSAKGSLKQWNTYSVDISNLVKPEGGAIYRVYLSFTKDYAIFECAQPSVQGSSDGDEYEDEYWYYDDYYYYDDSDHLAYNHDDYYFSYPRGYRWKERDNPCHISYYHSDRFVARNLLATNLGLIVKSTVADEYDFTVTDMVKNKPISGAEITLYNYQGRALATVDTDDDGWATLKAKGRPYFAVAAKGNQKTYLKLQSGGALSLSSFDVDGSSVKDGLKGFIYGERGVWRPGDTIFLSFILEDKGNNLPEGHPINFKLLDPRGMPIDQQMAYKENERIYRFTTRTSPSAVTGSYMAQVRVGDRHFDYRVRVETVKPNRLKVDLDFTQQILELNEGKAKARLAVNWLTGVASANSKVNIKASTSAMARPFPKYSDFTFFDPVKQFDAVEKEVFDGNVGADGTASVELDLGNFSNAPGMLTSRFVTKAFEGGGDFSTEYMDKKVAPYSRFIGMKMPAPARGRFLETDRDYTLKIKTLDAQGKPVSAQNLEVKIYKVDWHWWYNTERENLARFVNNEVNTLVSKGKVTTVNGEGSYKLRVNYPNWGRFLVRVSSADGGHSTGEIVYFDWPSSRGGERPDLAGATLLSFSTDKEKYEIGEEIVTRIPVSDEARMLITVESGTGLISKEWVEPDGDFYEHKLKATSAMAPNAYIAVSLLQPHAQSNNDRPMRLYGVVPVEVYDPQTELQPIITTKEVWRPETTVNIKVAEKNKRAMTYTLAVVDDGLLNLTRFKTPDPWNHFYAKEALGVKTWDMYNDVLGAFGGRLEQVFAIGGDEALNASEKSNMNRFVPMVRYIGPFTLDAGQTASHNISVPNYVGSARVMVVAANENSAYGSSRKAITVRKPLMVLTSLPRLLSPGDEVTLPVTVFAMEDQVRDVSVSLKTKGEVQVVGETSKKVRFTKNGEQVVDFKLRVPENRGEAVVRVEAISGNEKAYDEVKLKVRLPNPPVHNGFSFTLMPGKDTTISYKPIGVPQSNTLTVEASTIPSVNLQRHLKYLFGYPYGCTEQTVSRVFPLLYVGDIMDLSDDLKAAKKQNINIALDKIYERQSAMGEVAYWPELYSYSYNHYVTSYSGHFMIEAERKGYQIRNGVLSRWKKFQQQAARNWSPQIRAGVIENEMDQAYRLYTLALYKSAEVGAMNRMRELTGLGPASLWYLAASYGMIGQKQEAAKLAQRALEADDAGYYRSGYFGGRLRNKAITLMVLNQLDRKNEALKLSRQVAEILSSKSSWYSTHDLAFGLISFVNTYGDYAKKSGGLNWTYESYNENYNSKGQQNFESYEVAKNEDKEFEYTLSNGGQTPLNVSVSASGIPVNYDLPALTSHVELDVQYTLPNGKVVNEANIKQGQDIVATVTVKRLGHLDGYENMALVQYFPTGWEILNTRLLEIEESGEAPYDYKDIRDDRVYTFFNLNSKREVTYKIRLNATYAGRYYLPPVLVEDMYNHDIKARVPGKWVEVVR